MESPYLYHFILQLTIHYANGLKKPKLTRKLKAYVVTSISTGVNSRVTHTTHTDREHGTSPVWEYGLTLKFTEQYPLDENVIFKIRHNSSTQIDRSIGKVKVPLKDFVSGEEGHEKRVSYQVRSSKGGLRGKLILSHQYNTIIPPPIVNTVDEELLDDLGAPEVPNNVPTTPSRLSAVDRGLRIAASVFSISEDAMDMGGS